ncbi:S-adenosylmethionine transporter [Rickenella mellea]|uniref:S-adenosylmethionine transporter n=1 Tax=Rickenella mellea TaxID=50990 RepID=A0A4Y7PRG1_9AGAM|nr:S-adenosylmethionine transporter [Rickenella mellea]
MSPTFAESLIAGGIAGTSVDLLFYPIDTVKTRLQSGQGFARAGGFKGIYKGVGSVVVGSGPGAAAFFAAYERLKRVLAPSLPAPIAHMLAASSAEVAACVVRVPTEVVKSRAQTGVHGHGRGKGIASASFAAARAVFQADGLRGFYRGFGSTVVREIPFTSIQFPLYEFFKLRLARYLHKPSVGAHEAALCGSVAGGIAGAVTTPLDVLKTRTMLDMRDPTKGEVPSLWNRFVQIRATEGTRALFAGVLPRTLWISAGGAVFLGAYEWALILVSGS